MKKFTNQNLKLEVSKMTAKKTYVRRKISASMSVWDLIDYIETVGLIVVNMKENQITVVPSSGFTFDQVDRILNKKGWF